MVNAYPCHVTIAHRAYGIMEALRNCTRRVASVFMSPCRATMLGPPCRAITVGGIVAF